MKNILLTFSILVIFIFASCGNQQNKTKDTHTHPDGTVHSDDADHSSPSVSSAQEAFEVKIDSSTIDSLAIKKAIADSLAKAEQHKHDHEHGHNHAH